MICPNKNLPEWNALEKAQPTLAYYLWDKYQGQVPSNYYTSPNTDLYGLESDNLVFNPETLNSVISFIDNIGVKINFTNFSREDALAGINVLEQTILISEDLSKREKAWEKLPEEAAHWWYRLLKNSELKSELWNLARQSEKFKDLFKEDYGNYGDIDLLTEEAIGQLIAESIKRIETNKATAKDKSFWQKFKDFVNKILGKYKEYQNTPFDVAAEKLLKSDLSDLFTLKEVSQMYADHIGENVFIETDVANDPNVVSDIDYSKTFKSLMTRLKKRKRQPTEKTVQKIKDALSKDSKLKTGKLDKDFKEVYKVEDIRPSLLSFEKFSQKYQKGIPAKDNLSLDGVKAFDLSVYNAVRDFVKEYAPELITKNTIPYDEFLGCLNEFLEKNYLLNFQVLKGWEDYRVYNTFIDDQTRHRKVGLRFNDEYFQERSHFSHSPLAWGNITYFKSDPSLAEPDSVLIHEIQNDFFERLTDNPIKNANTSVEEIMNLPSLFKGLSDNNPELAYSQFKSKIKETQELINRNGLQKAIEYYRDLIEQSSKESVYGVKINDEFAESLFDFIEPNLVGSYENEEGIEVPRIEGYRVGENFNSIIADEFDRVESMKGFLRNYINLILNATFKNKPKSPSQLAFLLNLKIKKAAARNLIIHKNQLLSNYKAKSKLDAADNYDNLPFENFLELYDSVQFNKNFLMGDLAKNIKTETIQKTELWSKYFNPLVHHLIQTVIKEKGRDFKMYFPSHEIVMLSQVQQPNEKTKTPTADLYAGEEDVRQGKVKETGVMYRNMKKVNGVSLEFVDDIPGFTKPVYGYKIDVSKYNYQTPVLFGLDRSQTTTLGTQPPATIKPGVSELFNENPELASIGTVEQYSQYLDSIFPDSKVKDIVYHGTNAFIKSFDKNKIASNTLNYGFYGKGFYFNETRNDLINWWKTLYKKEPNIVTAIINTKNPYKEASNVIEEKTNLGNKQETEEFTKNLLQKNYDAVLPQIPKEEGSNEFVVFEPEQIHILGNKQDIEGFKQFVSSKSSTTNNLLDVYNNVDISNAEKEDYKIIIDDTLYLDNAESKDSYFGYWMPIMLNGNDIGRVRFEQRINVIEQGKPAVKTFNPNIQIYSAKQLGKSEDNQKKGIGSKVHIALYKYVKSLYPTYPFVSDTQNTVAEMGLLKSFERQGIVTQINPIGEISEKYGNYSVQEAPFIFNDDYFKQSPSKDSSNPLDVAFEDCNG